MRDHAHEAVGEENTFVDKVFTTGRSVVAIIDYRASQGILNVRKLIEGREREGRVTPEEWKRSKINFKSLTVFTDGSCLLHRLTAASMAKRMKTGNLIKDMQS